MLFQPDAQQVRAARLPHRVRWIRVRFGHPPTPLKHGSTSPCITLAMVHGCSPCAVKASPSDASQAWFHLPMHHTGHGSWMLAVCCQSFCDELISLGQQRAQRPDPGVREVLHTSHDRWQLRRTAGHASVERRRAAAPALLMLASQHDCASSDVELECGTIFDAQPYLTVVYDKY